MLLKKKKWLNLAQKYKNIIINTIKASIEAFIFFITSIGFN